MESNKAIRKWSAMYKMPVYIPVAGRNAGWVEDFYFKRETNAIYALLISTRVEGERAVPVTGIQEVSENNVSLINEEMMTRSLYQLPLGSTIMGQKVVGENGNEVGTVGDVYVNVARPLAMHIEAFELGRSNGRRPSHARIFSADDVVSYDENQIVIFDRVARRLH